LCHGFHLVRNKNRLRYGFFQRKGAMDAEAFGRELLTGGFDPAGITAFFNAKAQWTQSRKEGLRRDRLIG
jgi:hypothetical protein